MREAVNHIQRTACRCGSPPESCVAAEEVLTQFGWRDSPFRDQPRIGRELGLSVLRGSVSVGDGAILTL